MNIYYIFLHTILYQWLDFFFTDAFFDFIQSLKSSELTLTHQVLAILWARQFKCSDILEAKFKKYGELLPLEHKLCSRIWDSMMVNLKKGLSSKFKQDMFLEQIYVCAGGPGFKQFVNQTLIAMILKWQSPDGCFREYEGPYISLDSMFLT